MATTDNRQGVDASPTEEETIVDKFRTALGGSLQGKIQIHLRNPSTKKMEYSMTKVFDAEEDSLLDELRAEYPDGGDFTLRLCTTKGDFIATQHATLTPMTRRQRAQLFAAEPEKETPVVQPRGGGTDKDMFLLMMQMQQKSSDTLMTAMMGMMATVMKGGRAESPGELLNQVFELQNRFKPPMEDANHLDKLLDSMVKIKTAFPDQAPAEGLGGIAQAAMPLLAGLVAAAQNAPAAQPQQIAAPRPFMPGQVANRPIQYAPAQSNIAPGQVVTQAPANDGGGQGQQEMQGDQSQSRDVYATLLNGALIILNKGADADALASYIETMVLLDQISGDDINQLIAMIDALPPEHVQMMIANYGITNPDHVSTVFEAIALLTGGVDSEPQAGGDGGHEESLVDHGQDGGGGGGVETDTAQVA